MQMFVITNNVGIMIIAGANVKNWLTKLCKIKDLFGIRMTVSVNATNHVILMNI